MVTNKNSKEEKSKVKTEPEVDSASTEVTKKTLTLKEQVNLCKQEIEDLKDKKLRIAAEFENFRRRSFHEKADWIKNATERLILELCDVRDNFERALDP
ncbi:MAG: nucleotide exchange factor GrpE, partial [Candidatus Cloacimonetes bacterium]|nr:nucleotide exchange factor GrpE [Candidatus Cloacimonadota bacterium]